MMDVLKQIKLFREYKCPCDGRKEHCKSVAIRKCARKEISEEKKQSGKYIPGPLQVIKFMLCFLLNLTVDIAISFISTNVKYKS